MPIFASLEISFDENTAVVKRLSYVKHRRCIFSQQLRSKKPNDATMDQRMKEAALDCNGLQLQT